MPALSITPNAGQVCDDRRVLQTSHRYEGSIEKAQASGDRGRLRCCIGSARQDKRYDTTSMLADFDQKAQKTNDSRSVVILFEPAAPRESSSIPDAGPSNTKVQTIPCHGKVITARAIPKT